MEISTCFLELLSQSRGRGFLPGLWHDKSIQTQPTDVSILLQARVIKAGSTAPARHTHRSVQTELGQI